MSKWTNNVQSGMDLHATGPLQFNSYLSIALHSSRSTFTPINTAPRALNEPVFWAISNGQEFHVKLWEKYSAVVQVAEFVVHWKTVISDCQYNSR